MIDPVPPALRSSAAHVFVGSLLDPVVDDADLHHLRRVLRLRDGEAISLSDGAGGWAPAVLGPAGAELTGAIEQRARPPITIASAIPKGDRVEWMVQKLTELGVARVLFVDCARSVARWDGERAVKQFTRLRRIAREAAMQSRRTWLLEFGEILPISEVTSGAVPGGSGVVLADPSGPPLHRETTTVVIGPEGGFTADELACGAAVASISPQILRVETAAIAAAVLLCGA